MSFTGIGSSIGAFFGMSDLEDRFNQALVELQSFKTQADTSLSGFRAKGQAAFDKGMGELSAPTLAPDLAQLREAFMTQTATGLSPYAQLMMQDANRYLENRAISTGNLRSGAVGLQRAELGRRVVADEFVRSLQTFDTMRKGDLTAADMFLRTALGYGVNENYALASYGHAVGDIAGAYVGLGSAQQQSYASLGAGIGGGIDMALSAASPYTFTGQSVNKLIDWYKGLGSSTTATDNVPH